MSQAARAKRLGLAARERKLAGLVALVVRRKARIVEDFYDIGEALRTIRDERLYEVRGHTFAVFVEKELDLSRSTAFKLVAVVEQLPRERALELGQEKSYALVTYAAATEEADTPTGLLVSDAKIGGKAIREASAVEIRAAATAARKSTRQPSAQRAELAEDRAILAALRPLGLGKATLSRRGSTITIRITKRS